MNGYIFMLIAIAASSGWLKLWTAAYTPSKISGYIRHTVIFTFLSLLISWLVSLLIFSPVDDTYSASNIGALGMLFILWLLIFGTACLIAVFQTFGSIFKKLNEEKQNPDLTR